MRLRTLVSHSLPASALPGFAVLLVQALKSAASMPRQRDWSRRFLFHLRIGAPCLELVALWRSSSFISIGPSGRCVTATSMISNKRRQREVVIHRRRFARQQLAQPVKQLFQAQQRADAFVEGVFVQDQDELSQAAGVRAKPMAGPPHSAGHDCSTVLYGAGRGSRRCRCRAGCGFHTLGLVGGAERPCRQAPARRYPPRGRTSRPTVVPRAGRKRCLVYAVVADHRVSDRPARFARVACWAITLASTCSCGPARALAMTRDTCVSVMAVDDEYAVAASHAIGGIPSAKRHIEHDGRASGASAAAVGLSTCLAPQSWGAGCPPAGPWPQGPQTPACRMWARLSAPSGHRRLHRRTQPEARAWPCTPWCAVRAWAMASAVYQAAAPSATKQAGHGALAAGRCHRSAQWTTVLTLGSQMTCSTNQTVGHQPGELRAQKTAPPIRHRPDRGQTESARSRPWPRATMRKMPTTAPTKPTTAGRCWAVTASLALRPSRPAA